jgi:uncharacterized protein (DUF1697 family)
MQTYISLLRGINVNGKNIIPMKDLRNLCESLNFTNVITYIQSGNIIFQDTTISVSSLETMISSAISKQFGFEVPVLVLTKETLESIVFNNPFMNLLKDISTLHGTFLSQIPLDNLVEKFRVGIYGVDEYSLCEKIIYLHCPNGYGNTKLSNTFLENKLKVTATTRNWKTITQLLSIAENI